MDFEDTLKEILIEYNLTQKQLAELIYVRQSQISKWVNGKSQPSYQILKLICISLNISGDYILVLE